MGPKKQFELRENSDYAEKNFIGFVQFDQKICSDYAEFTVFQIIIQNSSSMFFFIQLQ